ncbi:MAG: biotin carboxylase N-terminal domain-containing protein [Pseudomonadota bacterium]
MFDRLLVANRGEIACRVMRTARRLGVRCIAVYSDADAEAMHVAEADEAMRLGPAPAAESYLSVDRVIAAAAESGADAIHPGYGFLSENAGLAEACAAAGVAFVGPSPDAIRRMGSKIESKRLAGEAGVPVVPGYDGVSQSRSDLRSAADEVGYPIIIKADAGGGGRGMRVVREPAGFDDALESASREAKAAFGDGRVLLERYIDKPRHIEVQVFGNGAGEAVHLFERDCSVQRRHQKVVEEAPALGLSTAMRDGLHAAAVDLARAMKYGGAGTVEFIVGGGEGGGFYFLEMNTRLQVEHPVTEMITGLDLVEWQLRVASGEGLPLAQNEIRRDGHAVEVRLYAEDPTRDFLPSTGDLAHLRLPAPGEGCRVDTGVRAGDTVTRFYDPMIAKIITDGADREAALSRLEAALADTEVTGVRTNRAFLASIAAHPEFRAGQPDTGFIGRHMDDLQAAARLPLDEALVLASFAEMESRSARRAVGGGDPYSPWAEIDAWRLFGKGRTRLLFAGDGRTTTVRATVENGYYMFGLPDRRVRVEGQADADGMLDLLVDGARRLRGRVVVDGDRRVVFAGGRDAELLAVDADAVSGKGEAASGQLTAPLPASVTAVHVSAGDTVARGDPLMVLEAMKMEHVIAAPADGSIAAVHYKTGDQVDEGADLIDFEQGEADA